MDNIQRVLTITEKNIEAELKMAMQKHEIIASVVTGKPISELSQIPEQLTALEAANNSVERAKTKKITFLEHFAQTEPNEEQNYSHETLQDIEKILASPTHGERWAEHLIENLEKTTPPTPTEEVLQNITIELAKSCKQVLAEKQCQEQTIEQSHAIEMNMEHSR